MLAPHQEYVIDEHQETKSVLLPFDEWRQLLEEIEELEDIRAYDEANAQPSQPIIGILNELCHSVANARRTLILGRYKPSKCSVFT